MTSVTLLSASVHVIVRTPAALSTDDLEIQLHRIDPVRKESLDALEYFRRNKHAFPYDQRVIVESILADRLKYRDVQAGVLTLIRNREYRQTAPRNYEAELWGQILQYDLLMVQYIDKCDSLITLSSVAAGEARQRAVAANRAVLGLSILLAFGTIAGRAAYHRQAYK